MSAKIIEMFPKPEANGVEESGSPEKKESKVDLDVDKMLWLMGRLASLRESNPEMFKKEKVDYEMGEVGEYDDYKLIMKVNNCTENNLKNNPASYLAINYEVWNRNLAGRKKSSGGHQSA
ncbi:MAG: hypothetical protein Q8L11_01895 [Candidatus Moranbacteria bacterium]|nr:hypothetical protein [bacterium]MDP1833661.1 hypothetical protein [Candidatus Moranbacteria bacterium]